MDFENNSKKSELNKEKHGIDFQYAQILWNDPDRVVIPAKGLTEPIFLIIAKVGEKHWSGIYTHRNNKIRIISVRRSRKNERKLYES